MWLYVQMQLIYPPQHSPKVLNQGPDYLHVHQWYLHVEMSLSSFLHRGKPCRSLKTQISEHRSNIRTGETKHPVAVPFVQAGHPISSLRYIGIEMVKMSLRGGDV